jgi:hypothetical protein
MLAPPLYGFAHGEIETFANWRMMTQQVADESFELQRLDKLCYVLWLVVLSLHRDIKHTAGTQWQHKRAVRDGMWRDE